MKTFIFSCWFLINYPFTLVEHKSTLAYHFSHNWTHWDIYGQPHYCNISIIFSDGFQQMQKRYKSKKHQEREPYRYFIKNDPYQPWLQVVAFALRQAAGDLPATDVALSFVQSLSNDSQNPNYQRYAIETLLDKTGDCSDKSVLLGSLLIAMGYDCIFLLYPEHMAVGLWSDPIPAGFYVRHRNRDFYYAETTTNLPLGECPDPSKYRLATIEEVL